MANRAAVLDACVLFPDWLRDLFLRCAEAGLLRVAWTSELLDELRRNLEAARGLTREQTKKLLAAMSRAFPDALVENYERHVAAMTNHPGDRHVMAAAFALAEEDGAAVVVTANVKDFPEASWPKGVTVVTPDFLLCGMLRDDVAAVVDVIWKHAQARKNPPVSVRELMKGLSMHAPRFVTELDPLLAIRTQAQLAFIVERQEQPRAPSMVELRVAFDDRLLADAAYRRRFEDALATSPEALVSVLAAALGDAQLHAEVFDVLWSSLEGLRALSASELRAVLERLDRERQ